VFSLTDKNLAQTIVSDLQEKKVPLTFMHVCGTHQDTLVKHGLDMLLQQCGIQIRQGPGCPVCVTTPREIEEMIQLARHNIVITTFGDMMQVPGEHVSLGSMKAEGCDVRMVYSIEDAVSFAENHPQKDVVFMAVGFETTAPSTAAVLLQEPPDNFSVCCCHRTMPYALKALLDMGEVKLDGLIEPGHVSTIIGTKPYEFISSEYHLPQVIAGFEPLDLLMGVWMLARQIEEGEARVDNEYTRVVHEKGNLKAKEMMKQVFRESDVAWRGFPVIPQSGLSLKKKYEQWDARIKYAELLSELEGRTFEEPQGCRCGELLRGLVSPYECPLFGTRCTPASPVGPCMVSMEGSCNIEYRYGSQR